MDRAKYIVIDNGGLGGEEIVVFPAFKQHKEMKPLGNIVSAGFVGRNESALSGFYTYGESISLGIKSRPEDQMLLDMLLKDDY